MIDGALDEARAQGLYKSYEENKGRVDHETLAKISHDFCVNLEDLVSAFINDNICMCGGDMYEAHDHAPVSQWSYYKE